MSQVRQWQPVTRAKRVIVAIAVATFSATAITAQDAASQAERAAARIAALQRESDRLAAQAGTVFSDLRKLEIDREIKQQALNIADAKLKQLTLARDNAADHVAHLEATRIAQTPGVKERLVALSKRGTGGYVQLLLSSNDVRAFGRMARGVAAVAELDRVRLETHRRTLAAERDALKELEAERTAVAASERAAARARAEVGAAVAARNRLLEALDHRRDLAAQFVTELQQAQAQLTRTLSAAPAVTPALPLRPFRGDLPWPVNGRITSPFGRVTSGRFGTSIVRNGIELAAAEGAPATAVHEGTVAYAAPFAGFGTLVIIDHGSSAFTLYGHLLDSTVTAGTKLAAGETLGRVGRSLSGQPALYFELRIDGRPVNPLEWLRGK